MLGELPFLYGKSSNRILRHVVFWILFYLYDGPITSIIDSDPLARLQMAAIALPLKIAATYFTLYLFGRMTAENRSYGKMAVYLLISALIFGILQRTVSYYFIYPKFYPPGLTRPWFYPPKIIIETFGIYSVVAIVCTLHFIKKWYISQREKQLLSNEKLQAELKYLKAQIHPHFLFNTLNNLYTLTLTDTKKAPEVVYKLSQLMSYMLYDSNKAAVPLQMEVDQIENYISLEKIRYDNRLDVALDVLSDIRQLSIAPLLVLPFVENSFKHGFSNDTGMVWVHISILTTQKDLVIKIENSLGICEHQLQENHKGLGLINVRKRLDLIYGMKYDLQIINEESFIVILKIKLDALGALNKDRYEMLISG